MKILVANLGSTSFKYRLFDMTDERVLARGGVERIGSEQARCFVEAAGQREERALSAQDHAVAVRLCLEQLVDKKCLVSPRELSAIGFKAVHAQGLTGVQRVDEKVLRAMEAFNDVAPAHNPPYVKAMRLLASELPAIPLVAAFETGFHETIAPAQRTYAVPREWAENHGIQRWGFHGASHRYIARRTAELLRKPDAKIISCHLGGSSSLCAISEGKSVATSMGMSPQSGLPQMIRVGDFDSFAIPVVMRATGKTLEQVLDDLANRSGLFGLCGHGDLRDLEATMVREAPKAPRKVEDSPAGLARRAFDIYVASVRDYLGAYLLLLNGADAIVFTGGIGENSSRLRAAVCANLDWFGIRLNRLKNESASGEMAVQDSGSRVQIWVMPTNEELIVARQTKEYLQSQAHGSQARR
ncbi:MAG: acetate/propionate family kinase [Planctomycetes bacterium]|nr:acetate/propionate family kinase [Planctomycetota bacterium]